MNTCDTKTCNCGHGCGCGCGCHASAASQTQTCQCHHCGGACGGDQMVCKMLIWKNSFHQAKKSIQVEILKEKIQKKWGSKMEKEADVILDLMEAKWKSMQAVDQAKEELLEKFQE